MREFRFSFPNGGELRDPGVVRPAAVADVGGAADLEDVAAGGVNGTLEVERADWEGTAASGLAEQAPAAVQASAAARTGPPRGTPGRSRGELRPSPGSRFRG